MLKKMYIFIPDYGKQTDMLVDLKMDTIEVILPLGVLVHTIKSFTPPPDDYLSALQEIALENLSKATEQSRLGLAHQLDLQKSLDLRVDIKAPVILVPQKYRVAHKHMYFFYTFLLIIKSGSMLRMALSSCLTLVAWVSNPTLFLQRQRRLLATLQRCPLKTCGMCTRHQIEVQS